MNALKNIIKKKTLFKMQIKSKKKILFLIQSCNREDFLNEEPIVRETWAKDIVNGNITNTRILFYRRSLDGKECIENDILYVNESDAYSNTYLKTIAALDYVNKNIDFDYIVRTNTSTYINTEIIVNLINSFSENDNNIYGTRLIINASSKWYIYLRGNCVIFSKDVSKDIVSSQVSRMLGPDDSLIGYNLANFWHVKGINYFDRLKQFSIAYWDKNFKYDLETCNKLVCYRLKINPNQTRKSTDIINKMKLIDKWVRKDEGKFEIPSEFNKDKIETIEGFISYEEGMIKAKNTLFSHFNQKEKMLSSNGNLLYGSENALKYMLD